MTECKEATTSRKFAHNKLEKKATDHHPNTLASHIWKRTEHFEIFGIITCNPNWATIRKDWQDSNPK